MKFIRQMLFVLFTIFGIPALIMLPFLLSGFIGLVPGGSKP
jgi:urea transporter